VRNDTWDENEGCEKGCAITQGGLGVGRGEMKRADIGEGICCLTLISVGKAEKEKRKIGKRTNYRWRDPKLKKQGIEKGGKENCKKKK